MTMITEQNLFEKGMLISLRMGSYAGRKKMSREQLEGLPVEIVRGVHDLFDKDFKELLGEMDNFDLEVRHKIRNNSIPFPIHGIFFIPLQKIDNLINWLDDKKIERKEITEKIINNYDEAIQIFAQNYPMYYEKSKQYYPTKNALSARFYFNYQFIKIAAPDENSVLSSEQYREEMKKFHESINSMKEEVMEIIYTALLESTEKLKEQCNNGKLNQRTFNSLGKLLEQINDIYADFIDRKDIKDMIEKIKSSVLGTSAKELRSRSDLKDTFAKQIKEIAAEIKALPDMPMKRAIEF